MPIHKILESNDFLKFDRSAYKKLSKNGKLVYLEFVAIHPNANPTDIFMAKQCDMSLVTYKKAKLELKDKQMLFVQRLGAKGATIIYHFGENAVKAIKQKTGKK